jgi:Asp-tRNA(Asn)/Glu-tRNA(Gln) amidotransferase A subunit family amidase
MNTRRQFLITAPIGMLGLTVACGGEKQTTTLSNFTGHPSLTLRAGFVNVSEARSDWAPDPENPLPTFSPPRRVPHGVTLLGRLFDEGTIARAGLALEQAFGVAGERPPGF